MELELCGGPVITFSQCVSRPFLQRSHSWQTSCASQSFHQRRFDTENWNSTIVPIEA